MACPHGKKKKSKCRHCSPCPHGRLKTKCAKCSPCPHRKRKDTCAKCSGCPHKKRKDKCSLCDPNFNQMAFSFPKQCSHGLPKDGDCDPCKMRSVLSLGKHMFKKFLRQAGIEPTKNKMGTVLQNQEVPTTNKVLEKIAGKNGWYDFKDEKLEEKGPKPDGLSPAQWARAILEYRAGREYQVAWRWTPSTRDVFPNVWSFYAWLLTARPSKS
jgi:hypothetical protein